MSQTPPRKQPTTFGKRSQTVLCVGKAFQRSQTPSRKQPTTFGKFSHAKYCGLTREDRSNQHFNVCLTTGSRAGIGSPGVFSRFCDKSAINREVTGARTVMFRDLHTYRATSHLLRILIWSKINQLSWGLSLPIHLSELGNFIPATF